MAINPAYLELRLSGGASNTDPDASLGGIMSSERIYSKSATGISNITGVTIDDAPGSANGTGTLAFTASGTTLTWTPNGGTAGTPVDVSADGRHMIAGSAGYLMVTVTAASLPGTDQNDTITVVQLANELWDDISKPESYDGDTEYRCLYVYNAHSTDPFIGVKVYIDSQPSGADTLQIGLDVAGIGDGASTGVADTIANESTAPDPAVTFSTAADLANALTIGQLDAGECHAIWQKRAIAAETLTSTPSDVSAITFHAGY